MSKTNKKNNFTNSISGNNLEGDFTSSIDIDKQMYEEDIRGAIAHTKMLAKQKIITQNDKEKIISIYKKTLALVMPTYVARSTLPLYEAFYFKVPVFYSKNVFSTYIDSA